MILTAPMPFPAALARLRSKTAIGTHLTSAQLQQVEIGVLDRAFFSARVNDARITAEMQSRIDNALSLVRRDGGAFMSRDKFINDMRALLGAAPGDSGDLTDLTSVRRLGLIYDMAVEEAKEYGRWLAMQDPSLRRGFPCLELVRIEQRIVPRGYRKGAGGRLIEVPNESWPARWQAAGGKFFDGRMIAPVGDPIWKKISRFGRPWGPFDFGSGMGTVPIGRRESLALGVIKADTPPPAPDHTDFNAELSASIPEAAPEAMQRLQKQFGDQIEAGADGKIAWRGAKVAKLYERMIADPAKPLAVSLGEATPAAVAAASDAGVDLSGASLEIASADLASIEETQADVAPVTSLDLQHVPHVWRAPDAVAAGETPGSLVFTRSFFDRTFLATFAADKSDDTIWRLLALEIDSLARHSSAGATAAQLLP